MKSATMILNHDDVDRFLMSDTYRLFLHRMTCITLALHNQIFDQSGDSELLRGTRAFLLSVTPYLPKE